jgi:hypothetical protein
MAMHRAIGITMHTGWGACVVVGGSLARPEIVANQVIEILEGSERFCFHAAAEMKPTAAEKWIERMREKALANARRKLLPLMANEVGVCAIVAKEGNPGDFAQILESHPRIHTAEGCFYRDILRNVCPVPVRIVPPSSLDISNVGKLAPPPWGRDQKLAALAAWAAIGKSGYGV